jgi:FkbM family methyltransferase
MKHNAFVELTKLLIDAFFVPLRKSKIFLAYLFNHTLRKELEEGLENGEVFPSQHIHRSIRLAKKNPDQDFIILDIGGGIGATAKLFNELLPKNKIVVFEPIHNNYTTIKSKFANISGIEVFNLGLGNENAKKNINVANRITASSIFPLSAEHDSHLYNEKSLGQNRIESIEIVRLDDFLAKNTSVIGIMKLDVQGYEMNVLKGAESTLKRTNIIVLEVNNHDIYSGSPKYFDIDIYLREHDFTLYDIIPSFRDKGKLKEWDVIYISKSALCALG